MLQSQIDLLETETNSLESQIDMLETETNSLEINNNLLEGEVVLLEKQVDFLKTLHNITSIYHEKIYDHLGAIFILRKGVLRLFRATRPLCKDISLHKVRENCHFLDHPPTPMSLRNIKMAPCTKKISKMLTKRIQKY